MGKREARGRTRKTEHGKHAARPPIPGARARTSGSYTPRRTRTARTVARDRAKNATLRPCRRPSFRVPLPPVPFAATGCPMRVCSLTFSRVRHSFSLPSSRFSLENERCRPFSLRRVVTWPVLPRYRPDDDLLRIVNDSRCKSRGEKVDSSYICISLPVTEPPTSKRFDRETTTLWRL